MSPTSRLNARPWPKTILLLLLLPVLISMTGCSGRYVVVAAEEQITLPKGTVDMLYSDNERLLKALEECRGGR